MIGYDQQALGMELIDSSSHRYAEQNFGDAFQDKAQHVAHD